jgi:hypothetical protein
MTANAAALSKRWLRGMLDRLRENTNGADDDLVNMMGKLDRGELRWTGGPPFVSPKKGARPAAVAKKKRR